MRAGEERIQIIIMGVPYPLSPGGKNVVNQSYLYLTFLFMSERSQMFFLNGSLQDLER
jgi:hypothetical protein